MLRLELELFSQWKQQIDAEQNAVPESNTGEIRTMRLAQSVNGEYSNYFGATSSAQLSLVLAGINATLTRSNGVYERDLGRSSEPHSRDDEPHLLRPRDRPLLR